MSVGVVRGHACVRVPSAAVGDWAAGAPAGGRRSARTATSCVRRASRSSLCPATTLRTLPPLTLPSNCYLNTVPGASPLANDDAIYTLSIP
ncbi:unnamed protein product [Colias eurytheme]|nr:unnamed protein product [Colias eurytheme]